MVQARSRLAVPVRSTVEPDLAKVEALEAPVAQLRGSLVLVQMPERRLADGDTLDIERDGQ
jgi:hypothetical protein